MDTPSNFITAAARQRVFAESLQNGGLNVVCPPLNPPSGGRQHGGVLVCRQREASGIFPSTRVENTILHELSLRPLLTPRAG